VNLIVDGSEPIITIAHHTKIVSRPWNRVEEKPVMIDSSIGFGENLVFRSEREGYALSVELLSKLSRKAWMFCSLAI